MNRTLRRPMFRIGGSAEGITSGLAPRQGYAHEPGHVKQDDQDNAWNQFLGKIPEIKAEAEKASFRDKRDHVSDFLMNWGLDLVSRPKSGNIFQQAATSAIGPFKEFRTGKKEAEELQYATESDMFKTMLGSYGDTVSYTHLTLPTIYSV